MAHCVLFIHLQVLPNGKKGHKNGWGKKKKKERKGKEVWPLPRWLRESLMDPPFIMEGGGGTGSACVCCEMGGSMFRFALAW